MSDTYTNMKPVKVIDPKVHIVEDRDILVKQGANNVSHKVCNSTTADNSQAEFTCTPPSPDVVISPLVYLKATITGKFKFTYQTSNNGVITTVGFDGRKFFNYGSSDNTFICLRQFPLASCQKTLTIKMNGDSISQNPADYINALGHFNLPEWERAVEMSSSPSQPDQFQKYNDSIPVSQEYEDVINPNTGAYDPITGSLSAGYGNNRNVFADYGQIGYEMPRGAYRPLSLSYDDTTKETIAVYEVIEPLFISPLAATKYNIAGLTQIKNFDVQIVYEQAMRRAFSIDKAGINSIVGTGISDPAPANFLANSVRIDPINGITVNTENNAQKLIFTYYTPQINQEIPKNVIYPLQRLTSYPLLLTGTSDLGRLALPDPNDNYKTTPTFVTVNSNNIILSSIPSKIYVFARISDQTKSAYTPDTYARLSKINVTFNGRDGILSGMSEVQLWRMSVANGSRQSFEQWKYYQGSICCIDVVSDMGVGANQAQGINGNFNLQIQAEMASVSSIKREYTLVVLTDVQGIMTISNGKIIRQDSPISSMDVLNSPEADQVDAENLVNQTGGSFFSGAKNVYNHLKKYKPQAKKAIQVAKAIDPAVEMIAPRAHGAYKTAVSWADKLIGQGYSKAQIKKMIGMGYTEKDFKKMCNGGNIVGGKRAPKRQIRDRMYDDEDYYY